MYNTWLLSDDRFNEYDCFSDGEMHDFVGLDKQFPDSKFILSVRPLESWLVSRINHVNFRKFENKTGWMRKEFEENPAAAVEKWIHTRDRRHAEVFAYFRDKKDQLLVIDLINEDDQAAAEKIARFLNLENPNLDSMRKTNVRRDLDMGAAIGKRLVLSKIKSIFVEPVRFNKQESTTQAKELIEQVFDRMGITGDARNSCLTLPAETKGRNPAPGNQTRVA